MHTLEFLVYRQEKFTPTCFVLITAEVDDSIKTSAELVAELRQAVTQWAKQSDDGRDAYAYAADDMNIGDLANYDLDDIVVYSSKIEKITLQQFDAAKDWVYDTSLCEEIDLNENVAQYDLKPPIYLPRNDPGIVGAVDGVWVDQIDTGMYDLFDQDGNCLNEGTPFDFIPTEAEVREWLETGEVKGKIIKCDGRKE